MKVRIGVKMGDGKIAEKSDEDEEKNMGEKGEGNGYIIAS